MGWVIDSSVAVKWFVTENEEESRAVRALLASGEPMVAPELLLAEVCNVLWKKQRIGEMSREQASQAVRHLPTFFVRFEPLSHLASRAWAIGCELDHPVYDTFFLALAEIRGSSVVSTDGRLLKVVRGTRYEELVKALNTFA